MFPFTHKNFCPHNSCALIARLLLCLQHCTYNPCRKEGKIAFMQPSIFSGPAMPHYPSKTSSYILLYLSLHTATAHLHFQLMTLLHITLRNLKQAIENFYKVPSPHLFPISFKTECFYKSLSRIICPSISPIKYYCSCYFQSSSKHAVISLLVF